MVRSTAMSFSSEGYGAGGPDGARRTGWARRAVDPSGAVGKDLESTTARADVDGNVVDQAGCPHPTCNGEQCLTAVPLGDILQGRGMHKHEVVNEGQGFPDEHGPGGAAYGRGPLRGGRGAGVQRPGQA